MAISASAAAAAAFTVSSISPKLSYPSNSLPTAVVNFRTKLTPTHLSSTTTRFPSVIVCAAQHNNKPHGKTARTAAAKKYDDIDAAAAATEERAPVNYRPVQKKNKKPSSTEAYALGQHIRMSAHKVRRVIDQIRGRSYEETLMILELMPYRACNPIFKLVYSAAANAKHNLGLNEANLVVSEAQVNEGGAMKRTRPRARGRSDMIRKPTCSIKIVLSENNQNLE
ncbi:hypothetical protein EZV62_022717 [Acer yangbiense]|uniref:Large ribosomal subunit protein uL22c n=1 Tax=Acer yangbiense TaxID=1000413 RepID=A0A5C7GZV4_9ROSI|nr:hypothetical protein EZV62_022717 [Acer yangbiense]